MSKSTKLVAAKAGLDLTSVSEIKSGLHNPSSKTQQKLAQALKVQLKDLIPF